MHSPNSNLLEDSFSLLESASRWEKTDVIEASNKYNQACHILRRYMNTHLGESDQAKELLQNKIAEYQQRADELLTQSGTEHVHNIHCTLQSKCGGTAVSYNSQAVPLVMAVPIVEETGTIVTPRSTLENRTDNLHNSTNNSSVRKNTRTSKKDLVIEGVREARASLARALLFDEGRLRSKAKSQYLKAADGYLRIIKLVGEENLEDVDTIDLKRQLSGVLERLEQLKAGVDK